MSDEPRAYTAAELQERLFSCLWRNIHYWETLDKPTYSVRDRLGGLAFSLLNIFDGTSMDFPTLDIVASPHPDDKQYHIDQGDNWIEPGTVINGDLLLHEHFYQYDPQRSAE